MSISQLADTFRQRLANLVEYSDIGYALYSERAVFPTSDYCKLVRASFELEPFDTDLKPTQHQGFYDPQNEADIDALIERYTTLYASTSESDSALSGTSTDVGSASGTGTTIEKVDIQTPNVLAQTEASNSPTPSVSSFDGIPLQQCISTIKLPGHKVKPLRAPQKCGTCTQVFKRAFDLRRHEILHTDIRPYVCFGCKGAFRRSDARTRHWKKNPHCEELHEKRTEGTDEQKKRRRRRTSKA